MMSPSVQSLSMWARASAERLSATDIALGVAVFLFSLVGSAAAAAYVLCRIPPDYLHQDPQARAAKAHRSPATRVLLFLGKNLLGALLVLLGIVLSLPGVPGQGILTIVLGVMLLDFPGKWELERRFFSRPMVLRSVNKVRARFGRPPLVSAKATLPIERNRE